MHPTTAAKMNYTPYTTDNEVWRHQFTGGGKKPKKFYTLKRPKNTQAVTLVTPTQQTVEQAKLQMQIPPSAKTKIKRRKKKNASQSQKKLGGVKKSTAKKVVKRRK